MPAAQARQMAPRQAAGVLCLRESGELHVAAKGCCIRTIYTQDNIMEYNQVTCFFIDVASADSILSTVAAVDSLLAEGGT